jgi:hypothetical protein
LSTKTISETKQSIKTRCSGYLTMGSLNKTQNHPNFKKYRMVPAALLPSPQDLSHQTSPPIMLRFAEQYVDSNNPVRFKKRLWR